MGREDHVVEDLVGGNAVCLGLGRDLILDPGRAYERGTYGHGSDLVLGPLERDRFRSPATPCLAAT